MPARSRAAPTSRDDGLPACPCLLIPTHFPDSKSLEGLGVSRISVLIRK